MTIPSRLTFVRKVWQKFMENEDGFDKYIIGKMSITDAIDGKITCELPVEKVHLNRLGSVHGGLLSTLVDVVGSLAIASKGMYSTGVSTDLNITFINSAGVGDIITMDSECVKVGKTLAFTTVDLKNKNNGKLIAQGRHTKFVSIAHNDPKNLFNKNKL
ncbi:putative PaaI_thioesterase family protein [Glomus cerebriforme]|uniref:Putative PaaI_thioesterase family protein n=1 Tax=Glomus cerebriforme TaxID=658196 RepID=A0A397SQB2_9GLOM|nr:putative PaaI_thioesterase family protein [Glomus cerebriforme]